MIGVSKVISTSLDAAKRLVVKILYQGKLTNGQGDVRTPIEASPFGVDSNPTEGKIAIYAQSPQKGKYYIIGYLNTDRKALVGETRLFSTSASGDLEMYLWLRNNGFMEIGGDQNHMTRYEGLETAFNQLKANFNTFVSVYNAHTHIVTSPGNPTGPAVAQGATSSADISNAKITEIKTI